MGAGGTSGAAEVCRKVVASTCTAVVALRTLQQCRSLLRCSAQPCLQLQQVMAGHDSRAVGPHELHAGPAINYSVTCCATCSASNAAQVPQALQTALAAAPLLTSQAMGLADMVSTPPARPMV